FPNPILLPKPPLKIKQADSLATAKFPTRQPALLLLPDYPDLLLRAEAPTRPPDRFILNFHPRHYPKSRPRRIVGFAYADTMRTSALYSPVRGETHVLPRRRRPRTTPASVDHPFV